MELNFVYCFDENFNLQALTSMKSLLDKISTKANIFIIHKNVKSFNPFKSLISKHENLSTLNVYQFDSKKVKLPPIKSHVSEATYYRLFISEYLPQNLEYLVYLDADIICVNDPTLKLFETFKKINSEGNVIAAKLETTREENSIIFNRLNLNSQFYFNAGVLIIKYSDWLDGNVDLNLLNILNLRFNEIFDYDQEVLNIYFDGKFTKLLDSLNFQAIGGHNIELNNLIEEKVFFLHYLGKGKPWKVENFISSTSRFYQREFEKLGFSYPHLIFPRNLKSINKFLKLIISSEFINYEERIKFLKNSFISFFTKKI